MKFNKKKVVPNTKIKLKLKAEPQSEMHVLAVDKKVLLLKTGNDITQTDVCMYPVILYSEILQNMLSIDYLEHRRYFPVVYIVFVRVAL